MQNRAFAVVVDKEKRETCVETYFSKEKFEEIKKKRAEINSPRVFYGIYKTYQEAVFEAKRICCLSYADDWKYKNPSNCRDEGFSYNEHKNYSYR